LAVERGFKVAVPRYITGNLALKHLDVRASIVNSIIVDHRQSIIVNSIKGAYARVECDFDTGR